MNWRYECVLLRYCGVLPHLQIPLSFLLLLLLPQQLLAHYISPLERMGPFLQLLSPAERTNILTGMTKNMLLSWREDLEVRAHHRHMGSPGGLAIPPCGFVLMKPASGGGFQGVYVSDELHGRVEFTPEQLVDLGEGPRPASLPARIELPVRMVKVKASCKQEGSQQ